MAELTVKGPDAEGLLSHLAINSFAFGGVKGSGYKRFGGQAALDEFTELRWINVQRVPRSFP